MSYKEFAEIAGVLAWPLTAILFVLTFYKPIRELLERLATLTVKTVKLKVFGVEVELTPEEAKNALNEFLQIIAESTNGLTPEESQLFKRILASAGRDRVDQLIPGFLRGTVEHERLQELRDRMLIRPVEGGRWKEDKHPVVTYFGQLVFQLRNAQSPKDAG